MKIMRYILLAFTLLVITSCGSDIEGLTPEEYIEQNNLDARELDNGVFIVVEDAGNEVRADDADMIVGSYIGRLTDETVFINVDELRGVVGSLIPGWRIGIKEIGEGGACTLIIPPDMAFGSTGANGVPPNSTVVYSIQLDTISKPRTIEEYILENGLEVEELEEGVLIDVEAEGNEDRPMASSLVTVNYTGRLTNGFVFDAQFNIEFRLSDLIEGWQIGLKELGVGGKCTLIIPSEVAYGSSGQGVIPPDSDLVFDLELLKIQ